MLSNNLTNLEVPKSYLQQKPSEQRLSEILEGLAVNGKIVIIGASNEPKVPPPKDVGHC